jgi:hypothetical protein
MREWKRSGVPIAIYDDHAQGGRWSFASILCRSNGRRDRLGLLDRVLVRLLQSLSVPFAESDGAGGPTSDENESDDGEGNSSADSTSGRRRDSTGAVPPDGIGHGFGALDSRLGSSSLSKLGEFGVGVTSGLGREVGSGAGVVNGRDVGGGLDERDVGTGVSDIVSRASFPPHLKGDVLTDGQSRSGHVGEGETGGTPMLDLEIATNPGKVVDRLRIGVGGVGKVEQLGVLDGGDRNVSTGCKSNEDEPSPRSRRYSRTPTHSTGTRVDRPARIRRKEQCWRPLQRYLER